MSNSVFSIFEESQPFIHRDRSDNIFLETNSTIKIRTMAIIFLFPSRAIISIWNILASDNIKP